VNIGLASGCCSNRLETSDGGEEPHCNSWLQSHATVTGSSDANISLVIWGDGLAAGEYVVEAAHNDAENTRPDMPYIHVGTYCDANKVGNIDAPNSLDCNGVYQIHDEETFDVNVPIQNLAGVGGVDDNLVWSVVKFYTDGAPVLITYVCGDESMAVINAFIIDMPGLQENAWEPEPERDATDLCPADVNFYWTPGIYADDHNVYFGTSMNDVNESAIAYTEHVAANSWTAPELKVDTTYYWRVETVNDVCAPYSWPGTIWSFSTHDGLADDPLEAFPCQRPVRLSGQRHALQIRRSFISAWTFRRRLSCLRTILNPALLSLIGPPILTGRCGMRMMTRIMRIMNPTITIWHVS
ncbi:MAG: hypothetical protein ACYS21_09220, partial [Planctomycetota bacterium]